MGSGVSANRVRTKKIHLDVNGKHAAVEFRTDCSTAELKELLSSAAALSKWSSITLMSHDGSIVAITPSIPVNTPTTSYKLTHVKECEVSDQDMFQEVLSKVGDEFSRAFKIQEFTSEFSSRLTALEDKFQAAGNKTVEIDKCKQELQKLQDQLMSREAAKRSSVIEQQVTRSRDVPLYPKYVLTQETVTYLKKPTFDIWHWENNEMLCLMEHIFHELGLVTELKINPITLRRWLLAVQEHYRDNPFHNFRHCFCVTQMMYGMINLCNLGNVFTKLETCILIVSAICHDLDHPGFNNNYQINARTELAIRYNDISPLENHHCAVAFQILEKPETNLFAYITPEHFKKIRAGIIELILATDMARHTEYMDRFNQILKRGFDYNHDEHRTLLKIILIKSCDISNEVRPMEVSEPWVDCLLEEYFMQSDREKSEGLPVAPFMDREKVTKPTAQIGFIKFVLIPMFEAVHKLFPQVEEAMLRPLRSSLEHYEQLKMMEDMLKEDTHTKPGHTSPRSNDSSDTTIIAVPLKAAMRRKTGS